MIELILEAILILYVYVIIRLSWEGILLKGWKNKLIRILRSLLWPIQILLKWEARIITWIKRRII